MAEPKIVDVFLFDTKTSILSDKPDSVISLSKELDKTIKDILKQFPTAKPINVFTLACLTAMEENKNLKKQLKNIEDMLENL